jgi:hypothetical protein
MTKPASSGYCGQQASDHLDHALKSKLDVLRKPLKLTATLKRRALKNKVAGNMAIVSPPATANEAMSGDTDG